MDLTCPKCHGTMRQYERNNVMVDQCTECRGVFLDRGELEKLIDAEARWADRAQPYQPGSQEQPQQCQQQYESQQPQYQPHHQQDYQDQPYRQHYYKKHKRRSFLDELFD